MLWKRAEIGIWEDLEVEKEKGNDIIIFQKINNKNKVKIKIEKYQKSNEYMVTEVPTRIAWEMTKFKVSWGYDDLNT